MRPYLPGDEVRSIDWNVTARMGTPFVRRYREERELSAMIVVDASIPVFAAPTPMSETTTRTWSATISGGISWNPLTPTEFWTVTAATATQACTPHIAIVRESA